MMIINAFFLMAASASVPPMPASTTAQQVFVSACFNGKAQLPPGAAQEMAFGSLPQDLRRKLGSPSKAQVWQLESGSNDYFYKLEYNRGDLSPRVCGVASNNLPFQAAGDAVASHLNEPRNDVEDDTVTRQWWRPQDGFMALASRVRDYTVLQVNWLSDAQRRNALDAR